MQGVVVRGVIYFAFLKKRFFFSACLVLNRKVTLRQGTVVEGCGRSCGTGANEFSQGNKNLVHWKFGVVTIELNYKNA